MPLELTACTQTLLAEIADQLLHRDDIAHTYAVAMMQTNERTDWAAVDRAIIERWSPAALRYIKTRAWKIFKRPNKGW